MLIRILLLVVLFGCQTKPTQIKEESVTRYDKDVVLVDTRSAFDYASFHISGSVNLNSGDFLILKNPKTYQRILDPDIDQVIERLAKRGISPLRSIVLISDKKDSDDNKKWRWLLRQLDVRDVTLTSLEIYRTQNKSLVPQAMPDSVPVWQIKNTKVIFKKSEQCFVNWSDENCR